MNKDPETPRALPAPSSGIHRRLFLDMAVLVLADLVEAGVPAERALGVLREAMRKRTGEQQMLGISGRVRQLMRQGQSPQDAAEQVRRALQRGRGGGGFGPPVPPGSEPITQGRRRKGSGQGGRG